MRNILNLANDRKFKRRSPNIAKFLKQICDQIKSKNYEDTQYINLFSKIHFRRCSDSEFVLIYGVLKIFFYLKANQDLRAINFDNTAPSQTNIFNNWDDNFKLLPKATVLKSAITIGSIKSNWSKLIKDFFDLVNKGDKEDLLETTQIMADYARHNNPNVSPNAQPEPKTAQTTTRNPSTGRTRGNSTAPRPQSLKRPVRRSVIANSGEELPRREEWGKQSNEQ